MKYIINKEIKPKPPIGRIASKNILDAGIKTLADSPE